MLQAFTDHPPRTPAKLCGILFAPLMVLLLSACDQRGSVTLEGFTMGTTWTATLVEVPASERQQELQQGVEAVLARIDLLMSTWRDDSELARFNASPAGAWYPVAQETWECVRLAIEIGRASGGKLDVTVLPLVELWGFGAMPRPAGPPGPEEIRDALREVGLAYLEASPGPPFALRKRAPVRVDLSALAPGYAVDRVAAYFEGRGIRNYLIEIGGEVRVAGHSPRGGEWRVAIESPLDNERRIYESIEVSGLAVATSGDYRNFFELDGVRYSHTIDPQTGMPVTHGLASVTVLARTTAEADAWATALNVHGPQAGMRLAEQRQIPALFLVRSGDDFVQLQSPAFPIWVDQGPAG